MPIYEYICDDCQTRYERIVMSAGQKIECPKCSSKRHTLQLSVFSAGKSANGTASENTRSAAGACGCTPDSCGCN